MPVTHKALASNDKIASVTDASPDTLYTATGVKACITACTVTNTSLGSNCRISLYILPSGVAASTVTTIATQVVPPASTAILGDILGHIVPSGGTIAAIAETTNLIYVTASGFEIS